MITNLLVGIVFFLTVGLVIEIGIASWNIRRAKRYLLQKESAKAQYEHIVQKYRAMDRYASDISWLLRFLYGRYAKFTDITAELEKGVSVQSDGVAVSEVDANYQDLKRADKILKVTIRAYDKIDGVMMSIASQISSILDDLSDDEEDDKGGERTEKENSADADNSVTEIA